MLGMCICIIMCFVSIQAKRVRVYVQLFVCFGTSCMSVLFAENQDLSRGKHLVCMSAKQDI